MRRKLEAEQLEWYVKEYAKDIPQDNIMAFIYGYLMGYVENDGIYLEEYFKLLVHFGFRNKDEAEQSLAKIKEIMKEMESEKNDLNHSSSK